MTLVQLRLCGSLFTAIAEHVCSLESTVRPDSLSADYPYPDYPESWTSERYIKISILSSPRKVFREMQDDHKGCPGPG